MKARLLGLSALLIVGLAAGGAGAQPMAPQPAQPGAAQPGQPGQPGAAQPGQPGQPGAAQPGQPGQPRPQRIQPGQPGAPRVVQPGGQPRQPRPGAVPPGLPPGHVPIQAAPPAAPPGPKLLPRDEHGHCVGHGPMDSPHHINWYQGLLGIDNEKSQSPSFGDRLLWRYHNKVDECDPKNQEPPFLGALINFLVVLGLIVRFGKKPVMEGLANRKKTIMQNIDNATALRQDAEKRLADYKKKLGRIEERRAELREESRAAWETEKSRILSEAQEKASRLRKDAEFRVSQELKQAEADLLSESVEGSVAAAEELLRKRIEDKDQERLAEEFTSSLGRVLSGASARGGVS